MLIRVKEDCLGETETITETVERWAFHSLDHNPQDDRVISLLAILTEDFIKRNPGKLDEVAKAIDQYGYDHELIKEANE
jgi:hypothetical protein